MTESAVELEKRYHLALEYIKQLEAENGVLHAEIEDLNGKVIDLLQDRERLVEIIRHAVVTTKEIKLMLKEGEARVHEKIDPAGDV